MRQFEIPFNHDEDLLVFLEKYASKLQRHVKHVFVAPFIGDYISTRHREANKPLDRQTYENQIKRLQKYYEVCILFNFGPTDNKTISYYVEHLNIKSFIVSDDEVAKKLKVINCTTIASITKRLQLIDIQYKDLSMYDYIVLDYTFNVSFDNIKQLPTDKKYILMVNTMCDYTCDFVSHWKEGTWTCPRSINNDKNTTFISPKDLDMFDEYISFYKLEGREYTTEFIKRDIMFYIFGLDKYDNYHIDTSDKNYYNRLGRK